MVRSLERNGSDVIWQADDNKAIAGANSELIGKWLRAYFDRLAFTQIGALRRSGFCAGYRTASHYLLLIAQSYGGEADCPTMRTEADHSVGFSVMDL